MGKVTETKQQRVIEQRARIKTLAELLIDNTALYAMAMGETDYPTAGCSFEKNSNVSKTALKAQITILRNELLKLSRELE